MLIDMLTGREHAVVYKLDYVQLLLFT